LNSRDSKWSKVRLSDGETYRVFNIAWGYDLGEEVAHITTNISPDPSEPHAIDFFHASEIVEITDDETGGVLFQADGNDAAG
jgi:hypothetical protein